MPDISEYLASVLNGEFSPEQKALVAILIEDFSSDRYTPNRTDYRIAAERLLRLLHVIDDLMIRSRYPDRTWREISLAFGLPSARYFDLSRAKIGRHYGLTKMGISKSVRRILKAAELEPKARYGT